jgi:hypothetical protein
MAPCWRIIDQTVGKAAHVHSHSTKSGCQIFLLHAGPKFATESLVSLAQEKNPGEIAIV